MNCLYQEIWGTWRRGWAGAERVQVVASAGAGAGAAALLEKGAVVRDGTTGEEREVAPRVGDITGKGCSGAALLEKDAGCDITQRTKTHTLDRCTDLWTHARL